MGAWPVVVTSLAAITAITAAPLLAGPQAPGPAQPTRDTPAARQAEAIAGRGSIAGRVVSADTGRPVVRARVLLNGAELPGGRAVTTSDTGTFLFSELPPGRYTVRAEKSGYVGLSYGQRRPLQPGTPLQLTDGQALIGVQFNLPRGSVVTGKVFDELGDPMPGILVRVMRYQYAQGNRQLVPAGAGQSDDRGQYRIWGLNPGEYLVSAVAPNVPDFQNRPAGRGLPPPGSNGPGDRGFFGGGGAGRGRGSDPVPGPDGEVVGYAPTYYPGVPSAHEARPVVVGLGVELTDIDFNVLLVRTSRIAGRVSDGAGAPAGSGNVVLLADGGVSGRAPGQTYGGRIDWDGSFAIANVPPGRYLLQARSGRDDVPRFATQPLIVNGDIPDVTMILQPGAAVSGAIALEATASAQLPTITDFRIAVAPTTPDGFGGNFNDRADRDGRFTVDGIPPGTHWIRGQAPRGWTLESASIAGRDIIDTPINLGSGEALAGLRLVFTDRLSEIKGVLTDSQGTAVTEYTVVAFPLDRSLWRAQSRHIMTARPDQNGQFQLRGLPPSEYYLAAVDPSEQGEWFDPEFLEQHRPGAVRVNVGRGDVRTQDLKVR